MYFAKNLRYLRRKNHYSQDDLASYLGYKSYSAIQKWEDDSSKPSPYVINQLCELFKVTIDELINVDLEHKPISAKKKGVKIPVLGRVQAGIPIEAIEEVLDYEEITEAMARTGEFFGLQIKGDSMEPLLYEKDVIIVKKQPDAESGAIVVVIINGNDATVKKLKKVDNSLMLISINPKYEPMLFNEKDIEELPVEIIGKAVELRRKF